MKEKFKNLSAPVGIVLSIVAVILFTGLLLGLGFVLGKIPGLNEQNDYLLQAIAEFIILIVFLIITFVIVIPASLRKMLPAGSEVYIPAVSLWFTVCSALLHRFIFAVCQKREM